MATNKFGSKFGTMAAIAGSAVGLGTIWKFPYVAGLNGGAAFLLLYVVISMLIAIPVMLAEFALGRKFQSGASKSFAAAGRSKYWGYIGFLEVMAALIILAFYSVVAGWSMEYIWHSVVHGFDGMTSAQMDVFFHDFVNSTRPVLWTVVFLLLNCVVLAFGVSKGIESCSKFMIPSLFGIILMIALISITLDGFEEGFVFFLNPDFSEVTGNTFVQALGLSFFSLSLGTAAMVTYGSYIKKDQSLTQICLIVVVATVSMAVLAGLAIFPSVFTYGVEVTDGPALVFKTLPPLFAALPGGRIISILFFMLLFFAALTSSFSLLEAGTSCMVDEWHPKGKQLSRKTVLTILFFAVGALAVVCALSQRDNSLLKIWGFPVFDFSDMFTSSFILPIGGISVCLIAGWIMDRNAIIDELATGSSLRKQIFSMVFWLIKWLCPVVIAYMLY